MTATDGKYVASFAYDAWIEISPSSRDLFISLSHRLRTMRGLKSAITLVGSPYPLVASFAYDAWIEIKFIRSSLSEKGSHRLRTMRGLKSEPASVPAGQSRSHRLRTMRGLK